MTVAPRCAHRFVDGRQCRNRARESGVCGTHLYRALADRLAEALRHERDTNGITEVGLHALAAYEGARK